VAILALQIIGVFSAFDCRLFIFHPECRGQHGKRSDSTPLLIHGDMAKMGLGLTSEEYNLFCSRYVFAPICRGVTSKRSNVPAHPENYENQVLTSILEQIKSKYEDQQESQENHGQNSPDYSWVVRGRVSPSMLYKDTENPTKLLPTYPSHIKFRGKRDSNDDLGTFSSFYKRSNTPLTDLGSFSSFYKRRLFKRNTGQTPDDLDTFSSMFKRGGDDLAAFTTFLKKRNLGGFASFYKKSRMRRQHPELDGFSSFFKRNSDEDMGGFSSIFKRDALDDLGAFSAFAGKRGKRELDLLDSSFSGFTKRRNDALGSFSTIYDPSTVSKRGV